MKNSKMLKRFRTCASVFATLCLVSPSVFAAEAAELASKTDKTGTNPMNFQRDIRIYNEYSWLNTDGDGSLNMTTLEYRTPIGDGKWQFRARVPYKALDIDNANIDESGLGDIDVRFMTILGMDMETRTAWAVGLEIFLDTASDPTLGNGATVLAPQIFRGWFFKSGLFAPGVQYRFSVDEDDGRNKIDQFVIDLNYLYMAADKQSWFFTDPQIVIDNEQNEEFVIVDFEFGWMMTKWYKDLKGHSFYIRPSIVLGADRPTDYSVELGYKMVGW